MEIVVALPGLDRAPARELAESVIKSAERAAHLTRQMLAYSGRGRFVIQPMDCSQQVRRITALIAASIPENVQLRMALAELTSGPRAH